MIETSFIADYHSDAVSSFRNYKKLAERAIEQVSDEEFFTQIDPESNSIAIIVKHLAGNLRSRWQDFLTADGEKENRNRDTEFELIGDSRESLMQSWEAAWATLFHHFESLSADDYGSTVVIRGETHTVVQAVNRQLTHYAYHVGQIVFLAKHLRSEEWKNLSVPRNMSAQFNQFLSAHQQDGGEKLDRFESGSIFAKRGSEDSDS